jgi:hypothetical protein
MTYTHHLSLITAFSKVFLLLTIILLKVVLFSESLCIQPVVRVPYLRRSILAGLFSPPATLSSQCLS